MGVRQGQGLVEVAEGHQGLDAVAQARVDQLLGDQQGDDDVVEIGHGVVPDVQRHGWDAGGPGGKAVTDRAAG